MERRDFMKAVGAGMSSAALGCSISIERPQKQFTFAHLTDLHIQPELRAAEGCRKCFGQVNRIRPDFVITGGDLVFDVTAAPRKRADTLYALYGDTLSLLQMPVHNVLGNHDVLGFSQSSPVPYSDPLFGKKMYEDRYGSRYYHFDYKGWRFIALDSIGVETEPHRDYFGVIDDEQMDWLANTLASTDSAMPVVVVTHIPILTAFTSYASGATVAPSRSVVVANGKELVELFTRYEVKAVLQGHTHVRETVEYQGCKYITSGAVCGNWWRGPRMGHPEGFGLLRVRGDQIDWEYQTYGWVADRAA